MKKQRCKILTFEYPNMPGCNYPKISEIKSPENYDIFHNGKRSTIIDLGVIHILL